MFSHESDGYFSWSLFFEIGIFPVIFLAGLVWTIKGFLGEGKLFGLVSKVGMPKIDVYRTIFVDRAKVALQAVTMLVVLRPFL
ncbi:MAG: hypothetical protein AB7H97_10900 [Pseudobdellovibrionaceae bacterium]